VVQRLLRAAPSAQDHKIVRISDEASAEALLKTELLRVRAVETERCKSRFRVNAVAPSRTTGRRLERNRKFVDSPLEGDGFELLVPRRGSRRLR